MKRRFAVLALAVALAVGLLAVWPAIDAWGRSATLIADVVLRLPARPLTWVTGDPATEPVEWGESGGRGLLTLPAGDDPSPALVLLLGARPAAPDDPRVARLVDSLARLGFVVLLPLSAELDASRVSPLEVERLVEGFQMLESHPRVDAERVAFVGLSAGGSLAIVAAADSRIAERVRFVHAIGPYFDAASLAASTLAGAYRAPDGSVHAWDPAAITLDVVQERLLVALSEEEREMLTRRNLTLAEADALLASLEPGRKAALNAISPRFAVEGLRAPLYLMHDRNDEFIPWPESDALAAAYEPEVYHRIELFEHVEPRVGNVPVLVRDGWRLLRLYRVIFERAR